MKYSIFFLCVMKEKMEMKERYNFITSKLAKFVFFINIPSKERVFLFIIQLILLPQLVDQTKPGQESKRIQRQQSKEQILHPRQYLTMPKQIFLSS